MPHTHHAAFESFWASAVLILAALIYVRGWVRIRRLERDDVEGWRAASFLLGLFFIWLAVASPLAALDHELLTAHMVQHLLLMTLAPPLIWLGAPVKALVHGLPHRFVEEFLAPIFRWPPMKRLGKALTNPQSAGLPPPPRWLDGTFRRCLCSGCNRECGMELSKHRF